MKRAADRPVLITDAERSQHDQLRERQVRYVLMMAIRALCLVLAAVLATLQVPLLWLWVTLCLVGMVLLPWLAVILANDRPPRNRIRSPDQPVRETEPRGLPGPRAAGRVIDAE